VPVLDGALALLGQGIASTLAPQNLALAGAVESHAVSATDPRVALLYDPQTAGGLLAGIPADMLEACLRDLRANGATHAACIGRVVGSITGTPRVRLTP
jgi:selenide,water dikinase